MGTRLDKLLEDFQGAHSEYKMDRWILGKAGVTDYGRYLQALREVNKRFRALKVMYPEQAKMQMQMEESMKSIEIAEREMRHFIVQAEALKKSLGPLTPEEKRTLEVAEWYAQAKARLAKDLFINNRITDQTMEAIMALPLELRLKLIEQKEQDKKGLIAWYLTDNREMPKLENTQLDVRALVEQIPEE